MWHFIGEVMLMSLVVIFLAMMFIRLAERAKNDDNWPSGRA